MVLFSLYNVFHALLFSVFVDNVALYWSFCVSLVTGVLNEDLNNIINYIIRIIIFVDILQLPFGDDILLK